MEDILDFLLSDLDDTVRGLMAFFDMVTPDAKDYLPFVSEEEQKKLHAEVKRSDRYKKKSKFVPQVSEGNLKIYQTRVRGSDGKLRRAWLCPVYDERGELVRRIYFDDGNVSDPEVSDAFAAIESRFKQRRPGPRMTAEYDQAKIRYDAGEDADALRNEYIERKYQEEIERLRLIVPKLMPKDYSDAKRRVRDKIDKAFKRRGISRKKN